MDTKSDAGPQQRFVSRTMAIMAVVAVLVVIPFAIGFGHAGTQWIFLSNLLFCVGLVGLAVCSIYWILLRVRNVMRK